LPIPCGYPNVKRGKKKKKTKLAQKKEINYFLREKGKIAQEGFRMQKFGLEIAPGPSCEVHTEGEDKRRRGEIQNSRNCVVRNSG
tara:strand:- start:2190 stop:2444 length:255 start_codon:yes stop_codon:yes gene_type:complete